jgi:predicted membrane protein
MEEQGMVDKRGKDRRNVAAILLIAAGGILFLETFDIVDISLRHYIFNWKTLLIAIGLIVVVSSNNRLPGYIMVGLGFLFWIPSIFDYSVKLGQVFWPVVLIAIGLIIISRRNKHDKMMLGKSSERGEDGSFQSDYIDDVSIFGGGVKRFSSQNLKGGNITAVFGGSEIDLTASQMAPHGSVVDMFTMFGGTKLIVPGSWQVKSEATSLFGGFTDKRHIKPETVVTDKILLIKGVVIFGGVEIKNY